ncbi:hypothetical protein Lepto7375DRAFT_4284 [Leptolyngbya sp. PCC 7375]|nr:hypothetical protein Lepto7375DRAFT_4284 [Leptolyngbya sp. PCC 7375]
MSHPNPDLTLLRNLIDLIEKERTRNNFRDKRLESTEGRVDQLEDRVADGCGSFSVKH